MKQGKVAATVDAYIASFPEATQALLNQMRKAILQAAPKAQEQISYMMPAYKLDGVLVYFGGYAKHIGFYPTGSAIQSFKDELTTYHTSKGTVQFPLDKKLPIGLIKRMVQFRVQENTDKAAAKKKLKK
ncbi:MAG: DUF1801 domain-containing protein [Chitinophagaceae bacterium]|jgi:uncharacterized protein YdhG (YjbR/CyaY superfamily)|nr:DUF1801 domain-containing protein [Chitinophagaceae bacterium]